jgi:3-methyladenine DNA glycosylase AlkD
MNPLDSLRQDLYGEGYRLSSFKVTRMVGTSLPTASIPIPRVREVTKAYLKEPALDLNEFPLNESVELTLVYFWIGLGRCSSFEEQMAFLETHLASANSWMITDGLPQAIIKVPSPVFLPYYRHWVASKEEYCKRFAYVMALTYYREDVGPFIKGLRYDESYYVMMGQAWMLATFAITHFGVVVAFLKKKDIPLSLKRKTISKMVDSFRITPEQKEIVKSLRTKN